MMIITKAAKYESMNQVESHGTMNRLVCQQIKSHPLQSMIILQFHQSDVKN